MTPSSDTQDAVDNILNQLKQFNEPTTAAPPAEPVPQTPEELEEFIVRKSSELINRSLHALDKFEDMLSTTPSEESAEALSNLINASSSAIETLNRVLTNNKKVATAIKVKEMDIAARIENNKRDNSTRLMMTRKELLKLIEAPEDAIDVESEKVE